MPVIDLGKVVGNPGASMRFRGEWLSGSEYFNNESYIDTVTHNGSLWICKTTNTGQEPIEGDYWGMGAYGTVTGFDATISIPATGWSGSSAPYAQTVSVSGMTATKAVVYALVSNSETPTDTENSNYGKITGISQNTDSVTFYAAEKPTADIVIRAFSGADTEQAADLSIIAAPFDAGSSYLADDYTLYEGQMYKFTENKDPGAWDTSKVTLTTVSDELKSQATELASQAEDIADLNSRAAWKLLGTATGDGNNDGTSLDLTSILDIASEIKFVLDFQYNNAGARARAIVDVIPQGGFKTVYPGGYYFSSNSYASYGIRITAANLARIDGTWWSVRETSSMTTPLNNDTATLYVYYR